MKYSEWVAGIEKSKAQLDSIIKSQGAKCSHNKRAMSGWLQLVIGRGKMDLEGIDESKIVEKDANYDVLMEDDSVKPEATSVAASSVESTPKSATAISPKATAPNTPK